MSLYPWRRYGVDEDGAFDDDGTWHRPSTVVLGGVLLPCAALGLVAYWLWQGEVLLRGRGGTPLRLDWTDEPLAFCGVLVAVLAGAGIAFAHFVVGNHPRWGWHAQPIVFALGVVAVAGMLALIAGVLL